MCAGTDQPVGDGWVHGGRLTAAMQAYPEAPTPWLDLSTGINAEPWSGPRAPGAALTRLPDPVALTGLEAAAARAFGVADSARVIATAGAETGLRLLPQVLDAHDVDIVWPTYSGHEAAWRQARRKVRRVAAETAALSVADALVLVNPNNPDGRTFGRAELAALAEVRSRRGLWTIVDESFVETRPELSVADIACERLIVLRSFGKFYGLPGLRLGFVLTGAKVAAGVRQALGEWPVGAEAIVMGANAYADEAWRARTRERLAEQAQVVDDLLATHRLRVVGGTSLFRLIEVSDARAVFEGLCRAGVLARPFAWRNDWLRLGVPRPEDFGRLDRALRDLGRGLGA